MVSTGPIFSCVSMCPVHALKLLQMLRSFLQVRAAREMGKQIQEKIRKDLDGKAKLFNFERPTYIRNLY